MNKTVKKSILVAAAAALFSANSFAEVTRHALPNNNPFPISRAVEVTPDTTLIFHAGMTPGPVNPDAEKGSREYYGDTETQALSVFKRLESSFKDFGGFMKAYTKYFGTKEQPNKPSRSAFQIAGLAGGPNMLIEIEVVLAKPE